MPRIRVGDSGRFLRLSGSQITVGTSGTEFRLS